MNGLLRTKLRRRLAPDDQKTQGTAATPAAGDDKLVPNGQQGKDGQSRDDGAEGNVLNVGRWIGEVKSEESSE